MAGNTKFPLLHCVLVHGYLNSNKGPFISGGFFCVISHYLRLVLGLVLWLSRVLESVLPLQCSGLDLSPKSSLCAIYQEKFHLK